MMKTWLTTLIFLVVASGLTGQSALRVGDSLPDLTLTTIGGTKQVLRHAPGKVFILEFWATWCAPCRKGLSHLSEVQKQVKDHLEIVAISRESAERQQRFVRHTGLPFQFVTYPSQLDHLFPHRVIPHSILIGPDGIIQAITAPEHITAEVIHDLLNDRTVSLPQKKDQPWDPRTPVFERDSQVVTLFEIQPQRTDAPTYSLNYSKGPFAGRRLTLINFPISGLYRHALQTTIYRMDMSEEDEGPSYCVDLIVPEASKTNLYQHLLDSLHHYFQWQLDTVIEEREVWVLQTLATGITLPPSSAEPAENPTLSYSANGSGMQHPAATMESFAAYLEEFGLAGRPVINETGSDNQRYQLNFSFDPENTSTFWSAIEQMGLRISKETRPVSIYRVFPSS